MNEKKGDADTAGREEPAADEPNYYKDFGEEAGAKGQHPYGSRHTGGGDPNAQTMADHDQEGEGARNRGRRAITGDDKPMTEQAADQPEP